MIRLDEILKTVGEPTRLRILNLLRLGSICVCDLQVVLDLPQPTVSRHLGALRHAGLVIDARVGPRVIYSLAPATTPQLKAIHQMLATVCPLEEELLPDLIRLKQLVQHRGVENVTPAHP